MLSPQAITGDRDSWRLLEYLATDALERAGLAPVCVEGFQPKQARVLGRTIAAAGTVWLAIGQQQQLWRFELFHKGAWPATTDQVMVVVHHDPGAQTLSLSVADGRSQAAPA